MSNKTIGRIAAAVAITGASLVAATGTSQAEDCTQYGTNVDGGFLYTNGAVPYRRGPATGCASTGNRSGKAAIWCSKYNDVGNLWYYARDISSNVVGWVWAGNVSRTEGSNHRSC
ncbi:hypothetical protein [Kribbella sp. CA-293567]|uniref:hypothetical protein n=1 Tax=Kribbella sp. CA-293567 TaxID=3002436 RepID=UPI0022DE2816|nr:hypothetical protein [Kribbella sp. CA-293567]WBQ04477.1 hypothetical protein OX958_31505 [Kribbella sp. CA-293567]